MALLRADRPRRNGASCAQKLRAKQILRSAIIVTPLRLIGHLFRVKRSVTDVYCNNNIFRALFVWRDERSPTRVIYVPGTLLAIHTRRVIKLEIIYASG